MEIYRLRRKPHFRLCVQFLYTLQRKYTILFKLDFGECIHLFHFPNDKNRTAGTRGLVIIIVPLQMVHTDKQMQLLHIWAKDKLNNSI